MRNLAILAVFLSLAVPGPLRAWEEPQRGTQTRAAMMDALRPHAEWMLGRPVEFVVGELRRAGDVGFAAVYPQRPGGKAIDPRYTPGFARGELDPEFMDGTAMQALFQKSGKTWVAVHWSLGATDVWFAYEPLCATYRAVIPEVCENL